MERENEDVQSGPVTHGGEGDPLGGGVAEPGSNDASTTSRVGGSRETGASDLRTDEEPEGDGQS